MKKHFFYVLVFTLLVTHANSSARAESNEELAKKLANPVASLISVPFQFNYDQDIGVDDEGTRLTVNIQPVIPVSINEDWNLISRTIFPVIHQDDVSSSSDSETGTGDTVQSFFFSPVKPTESGWIWGAGPVFLLPTASDDVLGTEKWGVGPTGVALKQVGPWSYGALVNHIVSVAGDSDRADVNRTFLQPFLSYTTKSAITIALNTESTYDWETEEWVVPVNFNITNVVKLGSQMISLGGRLRYWAVDTDTSPEGLGFRLQLTFLFPK